MIRWFTDLLYGSIPAEFDSSFGIDESVRRLKEATARSVFSALTRQAAVGVVKESRVSLQRVIPLVGNPVSPYFVGHFHLKGGRVVLVGRFTMHWWVKAFLSLWFGFGAFWIVLVIALELANNQTDWLLPLAGMGIICAGASLVWVGKWFARNDPRWLSNVLRNALSNPSK